MLDLTFKKCSISARTSVIVLLEELRGTVRASSFEYNALLGPSRRRFGNKEGWVERVTGASGMPGIASAVKVHYS